MSNSNISNQDSKSETERISLSPLLFPIKFARSSIFWKALLPDLFEISGMGLCDAGASVSIVTVSSRFDMNSVKDASVSFSNLPVFEDNIWMLNGNVSEFERFWSCDVWPNVDVDAFVSRLDSNETVLTCDRIISFFIVKFNFCWHDLLVARQISSYFMGS